MYTTRTRLQTRVPSLYNLGWKETPFHLCVTDKTRRRVNAEQSLSELELFVDGEYINIRGCLSSRALAAAANACKGRSGSDIDTERSHRGASTLTALLRGSTLAYCTEQRLAQQASLFAIRLQATIFHLARQASLFAIRLQATHFHLKAALFRLRVALFRLARRASLFLILSKHHLPAVLFLLGRQASLC